jgi:peptidyl-tRNA hydrolase ICT1
MMINQLYRKSILNRNFVRLFHTQTTLHDKIKVIRPDKVYTFDGKIPREKLTFTFARSSGAGGQNVNKVNTKATLKLHIDSADWIPADVKEKMKRLLATKINKEGELIIQSSVHRTQNDNIDDAIDRLKDYLKQAYEVDVEVEHVLGRNEKSDHERMQQKKRDSMKKKLRQGKYSGHD